MIELDQGHHATGAEQSEESDEVEHTPPEFCISALNRAAGMKPLELYFMSLVVIMNHTAGDRMQHERRSAFTISKRHRR